MIGTIINQYKITEHLGSGGMGEVYLATDTKLDRNVALKFLPPHLSPDGDIRARFKQETKAAGCPGPRSGFHNAPSSNNHR